MQKIFIVILIFLASLLTLTYGEGLLSWVVDFVSNTLYILQTYWNDIYTTVYNFILTHPYRLIIALLITVVLSLWIFRHNEEDIKNPMNRRKIAIVLAILLGWLGVHRFYLGQIGLGILYLFIFFIFPPLVILLSFIDAIRFLLHSNEEFIQKYPS